MNRAEAIRAFLSGRSEPATIWDIQLGLEEQRLAEGVDRDKFANRVGAQVSQLVKAGKLVRTGLLGSYRYALAKDAHVDRRLKPATTGSTARKRRQADKPTPKPTPPSRAPHTKIVLASPAVLQPAAGKLTASDQIALDVAAFLARGGQIERLSPGQCAQPTRAWLEANGLAKPRKPKKKTTTRDADDELADAAA